MEGRSMSKKAMNDISDIIVSDVPVITSQVIGRTAAQELRFELAKIIPAWDDKNIQPGSHKLCPHGNDLRMYGIGMWPCKKCLRNFISVAEEWLKGNE